MGHSLWRAFLAMKKAKEATVSASMTAMDTQSSHPVAPCSQSSIGPGACTQKYCQLHS